MAESPKPPLGENGDLIAVDEGGVPTPILEEEEENSVDDSTATTSAGLNVEIFKIDEGYDQGGRNRGTPETSLLGPIDQESDLKI